MRNALLVLFAIHCLPAAAEAPHPLKWLTRWLPSRSSVEHLKHLDPVFRSARVPLIDVRSCADQSACVIVNGRKIELEATPLELWHQRVTVVGVARGAQYTSVFAKVRFGAWAASEPDLLLIWAKVRNTTRKVTISGYTIDRDDQPGAEFQTPVDFTDFSFLKYLTSRNPLEVEVARELVERKLFCTSYPAEPLDTIHDEVAPLQHANLVGSPEAQQRLVAIQSVAGVIDTARGEVMCDSPITDHVDAQLEQAREQLEIFAPKLAAPPTVTPAPKVEIGPKLAAPPAPNEPAS